MTFKNLTADFADLHRSRQIGRSVVEQESASTETKDPRTHAIIGAAMEVHRQMGSGFLESVYHEALAIEFTINQIPYRKEVDLPVQYKGQDLACAFRADFVCYENLIVEIKAIPELTKREFAQVINALRASGSPIGLLINFGGNRLDFKRFVESPKLIINS